MKIYIAGKISGDKNYKRKFKRAEKFLRSHGHSVMNPAWVVPSDDFCWTDYMKVSEAMQEVCDITVLLPDWFMSKGAREEYRRARDRLRHPIYELLFGTYLKPVYENDLEKLYPPISEYIQEKPEK